MAFLGIGKKKDVVDLSGFKKPERKAVPASSESPSAGLGFFDMTQQEQGFLEESAEDKRKKLAKRLMDMTEKLENISNQIYHLQQRVDLLEKKNKVGDFEGTNFFN